MNRQNFSKLLLIIFWILFIVGISLTTIHFITRETKTCSSDPLAYSVNYFKNTIEDVEYVYGTIYITTSNGLFLKEDFGDLNITEMINK